MKATRISLEHLHKDILELRKDVEDLKNILQEDQLELSDYAKKAIEKSRKENKFVSHEEVEKMFLK